MKKITEKLLKIATENEHYTANHFKENTQNISIDFTTDDQYKLLRINHDELSLYSAELISTYLKGAIIGEVYLMRGLSMGFGSVSSTSYLAKHLISLDVLLAKRTFQWANSFGFNNHFFSGWFNSEMYHKNIIQYCQDEDDLIISNYFLKKLNQAKTFQSNYVRDAQRNLRRKEREQIEISLLLNDERDQRSVKQLELINILKISTHKERLYILSSDKEHTHHYYPLSLYNSINLDDFKSLDEVRKKNLVHIFELPVDKTSSWFHFYRKLSVLDIIE